MVEPPPLCNLPLQTGSSTADAAQLQKLRAEVSGAKTALIEREIAPEPNA